MLWLFLSIIIFPLPVLIFSFTSPILISFANAKRVRMRSVIAFYTFSLVVNAGSESTRLKDGVAAFDLIGKVVLSGLHR